MKKSMLLFMCFFGMVLNTHAQYPIPSYNVPVFPQATLYSQRCSMRFHQYNPCRSLLLRSYQFTYMLYLQQLREWHMFN
jgi:hypothetical protein